MERVARVFDEDDVIRVPEGAVVKARMDGIWSLVQQRKLGVIAPIENQLEDRSEAAIRRSGLRAVIRIASFVEVEFGEVGAGAELAVFGALERSRVLGFSRRDGIERSGSVDGCIVDSHPGRVEDDSIGVHVLDVLRKDGGVGCREEIEVDRAAGVSMRLELQGLQLPAL